ncbi:MAG: aminopeptidase [DPANN group archaeon]|nr:aminopeptidase [DPANN group archaeon]
MNMVKILKDVFDIKQGEKVLVLTDDNLEKNAEPFFEAAKKLSENTIFVKKPIGNHSGEEPSDEVAKIMLEHDISILITTNSLTHTNARIKACENGARIASMPGFNELMFDALDVDSSDMDKLGLTIKDALMSSKQIRVITPSGTDISFDVRPEIDVDTNNLKDKCLYGNLPAGEVFFAPLESTANGIIVVDIMKDANGVIASEGAIITVKEGLARDISDKGCKLSKLFDTIENARNIAEFGIGINMKAEIIGFILQDEKVFGTCHIAFGNSTAFGGKVYSDIHYDSILFKPTIYADDKVIMKDGKLLI